MESTKQNLESIVYYESTFEVEIIHPIQYLEYVICITNKNIITIKYYFIS